MLPPDEIERLGNKAQQLLDPVIDYLLQDVAQRISEAGGITSTATYQIWRLQQLGRSQAQVKKEIAKLLHKSEKQVEALLQEAAEIGYIYDLRSLPMEAAIPFAKNKVIQDFIKAAVDMADEDLRHLTQTIGFVGPDGQYRDLTDAYNDICDFAFTSVATGAMDYNTAVRMATKNLADRGIEVIDYASGIHTALEAAVRRNIMGASGLMQERISQQLHDDLGADGWEISAHGACAPDHEPIQGKQYPDAEYQKINEGMVRRIGTLNCGHAAHPIILGVSKPQYTQQELEELRRQNTEGVTVDGRHFTTYEATQHQRKMERSMRRQRRRVLLEKQAPTGRLRELQTKERILRQRYFDFSEKAGLRTQMERTYVSVPPRGTKLPEPAPRPKSKPIPKPEKKKPT